MWGLRKLGVPEWMARKSVGFGDHYQAAAKILGSRHITKKNPRKARTHQLCRSSFEMNRYMQWHVRRCERGWKLVSARFCACVRKGEKSLNEFEQRVEHFIALRTRAADTINAMVEMELVSADEESRTMTLRFPLHHWEMNPVGRTHGGILCTLLDMAMGGIAYACSDADFTPTIQMSVNFVKGSETGEDLYVEAVCDHCGSRMLMTRAVARLKPGDVVATAVGSYANNKKKAES